MNEEQSEKQMQHIVNILDRTEDQCMELLLENLLQESPCPYCAVDEFLEDNETRILSELYKVGKANPQLACAVVYRESTRAAMAAMLLHRISDQVSTLFEEELEEICKGANESS